MRCRLWQEMRCSREASVMSGQLSNSNTVKCSDAHGDVPRWRIPSSVMSSQWDSDWNNIILLISTDGRIRSTESKSRCRSMSTGYRIHCRGLRSPKNVSTYNSLRSYPVTTLFFLQTSCFIPCLIQFTSWAESKIRVSFTS